MKLVSKLVLTGAALFAASGAYAQNTMTSPTGGALPTAVTKVGGVVLDLKGLSGARVVTQTAASTLYQGTQSGTPLTFGFQDGFSPAVLTALGGGFTSASVRITLYDGDTKPGDFNFNANSLLLDGVNFGNFSNTPTYVTSADGTTVFSTGTGFGDGELATGFFTTSDAALLASLFTNIAADGRVNFQITDANLIGNFLDFKQGVDGSLINVGTGPIVTPSAVPEPATWAMMLMGFGVIGGAMRRRQSTRARIRFA